jgi:uncharacterized membrane-anchored protein
MRGIHVPRVNGNYWGAILLASVFGTNLGDYYAHQSGLGVVVGVILLAVLTIPVFVLERFDNRSHAVYYWLVIILIRTGATNIADFLQFREHIPQLPLSVALAVGIALFGFWQQQMSDARGSQAARASARMPDSGMPYWLAMLSAGIFGTVLGDFCSSAVGKGTASIALLVLLALSLLVLLLLLWRQTSGAIIAVYWFTVAVARTAGTAIGDWLAGSKDLDIGLPFATAISGVAFVALLLQPKIRRPTAGAA